MRAVSSLREGLIIALALILILLLFFFQHLSNTAQENIAAHRDGERITGRPIVITGPSQTPPEVPPPTPTGLHIEQKYQQDFERKNVACLTMGGVTVEDVFVLGNLLSGIDCALHKKQVDVTVQDKCVLLRAEQDLYSVFCASADAPSFRITIPETGPAPELLKTSKNYNGLILFILFLLILFLTWREFELRESKKERELRKKMREAEAQGKTFVPEEEEKKTVYIKAAPLFKDVEDIEKKHLTPEEIEQAHQRFVQQELERGREVEFERLKKEEVAEYIMRFNTLTKKVASHLQRGELDDARRAYLLLFPLYTRLYASVDYTTRADLQSVLTYLHIQLQVMEKSRFIGELIEKAYNVSEKKKEGVQKAQEAIKSLGGLAGEKKEAGLVQESTLAHIDRVRSLLPQGTRSAEAAENLQRELDELRTLLEEGKKASFEKYKHLFGKKKRE